jgi:hypothetical protein
MAAATINVSILLAVNVLVLDMSGSRCTHAAYRNVPAEKRMHMATAYALPDMRVAHRMKEYVAMATAGEEAEKINRSCKPKGCHCMLDPRALQSTHCNHRLRRAHCKKSQQGTAASMAVQPCASSGTAPGRCLLSSSLREEE